LKQGERISNLEKCFSKSYSFTFDYLQKDFEKGFTKEFAKAKHMVQAWSKMLKIKETIHAYFIGIYIGSIPSNLCTDIMQTSSNYALLYLLWFVFASITKKGEIERELGLHLFPN
jgi:uncharacterized membrane protein YbjE (DUF340 family)